MSNRKSLYSEIEGFDGGQRERIKVPGGWIVERQIRENLAMCFVPDPVHEWTLHGAEWVGDQ